MFKLVLCCDYTREPERRLLRGLSDFAATEGGWSFFRIPPDVYKNAGRRMEVAERARTIGADAIFGRWDGVDRALSDPLGIPVVLRTVHTDYPDYPMLSGEYREIGRMAARFYVKQHYDHYAFFGYEGLIWSDERLEGFEQVLSDKNLTPFRFKTNINNPDEEAIKNWLRRLPKPVALFATNDVLASMAGQLCLETGIRIPDEVAILGADNDTFLCNITTPAISSIHLDFEKQGYELGEALSRMRKEGIMPPIRIKVHPTGIEERGSTLRHNIKDPYIRRIVDFIDTHFDTPISMEDIVRDIPLSRRSIEIRFKKEMAPETILTYLNGLRIKLMCKYLATTDLPVTLAAEKAGFTDVFNVGRSFKRYTGTSPEQYRKQAIADQARRTTATPAINSNVAASFCQSSDSSPMK